MRCEFYCHVSPSSCQHCNTYTWKCHLIVKQGFDTLFTHWNTKARGKRKKQLLLPLPLLFDMQHNSTLLCRFCQVRLDRERKRWLCDISLFISFFWSAGGNMIIGSMGHHMLSTIWQAFYLKILSIFVQSFVTKSRHVNDSTYIMVLTVLIYRIRVHELIFICVCVWKPKWKRLCDDKTQLRFFSPCASTCFNIKLNLTTLAVYQIFQPLTTAATRHVSCSILIWIKLCSTCSFVLWHDMKEVRLN